MKPFLTILILFTSLFSQAQNLIISGGISHTKLTFNVLDRKSGSGSVKFNNSHFAPDLNVLVEFETKKVLSFKTGLYVHYEYYNFFIWNMESKAPLPGFIWTPVDLQWKIYTFDIPLLFSFNYKSSKENAKIHIDLGPYIGFAGTDSDGGLNIRENDFGGQILLGYGTKEWQYTIYAFKGFINRIKPESPLNMQKANTIVIGLNFTRYLSLKRKNSEKPDTTR
jgi:hypothetical protein